MGWVFLQVFLAFGTGILIVWWTWPKASKPPKPPVSHEVPGTQQQVDAVTPDSTNDRTN